MRCPVHLLAAILCLSTSAHAQTIGETTGFNEFPIDAQSLDIGSHTCRDHKIIIAGSFATSGDIDYYVIEGRRGDLLYANAIGTGDDTPADNTVLPYFTLEDSSGIVMRSPLTLSTLDSSGPDFPSDLPASPGPGGGVVAYLPESGTYYLRLEPVDPVDAGGLANSEVGPYEFTVVLERSGFEREASDTRQIIYLDFDGGTIDFRGTPVAFSPIADSLADWGLSFSDESALVDEIIAEFEEALDRANDPDLDGLDVNNAYFGYEIRSSFYSDPPPYTSGGRPNRYTTVIMFGESTTPSANQAETTDLGNYNFEQVAYVNTEILSGTCGSPCTDPLFLFSTNSIARSGVSDITLVARAAGRIAAHEMAHALGCEHTLPCNSVRSLMDTALDPGNPIGTNGHPIGLNILGFGPDEIYGTVDDEVVRFQSDDFNLLDDRECPSTTFTGPLALIDQQQRADHIVAFGLSTAPCPVDMDLDGDRDLDDIDLWSTAFLAGSLEADMNGDCTLNTDDIDSFTTYFTAVFCP